MNRKQYYITDVQEDHLAKMAKMTGITSSEYLRRIIDEDIEQTKRQGINAGKDKHK